MSEEETEDQISEEEDEKQAQSEMHSRTSNLSMEEEACRLEAVHPRNDCDYCSDWFGTRSTTVYVCMNPRCMASKTSRFFSATYEPILDAFITICQSNIE